METAKYMKQLNNYADDRLIRGCIYCGGHADTRDHIPSKCLLDKPYPENLPVIGCCYTCNQNFSSDEQYVACFIECVRSGSTNPDEVGRASISKILRDVPSLRKRINDSMRKVNDHISFIPEWERINNIMLKLAKGHVAFELSLMKRSNPKHFWCGLLSSLPEENQIEFNSVHFQKNVGEIGSRAIQRLLVTDLTILDENGNAKNMRLIFNDWIDVQDNRYRYIAIDDSGMIIIRIVIDEFFVCEVVWEN